MVASPISQQFNMLKLRTNYAPTFLKNIYGVSQTEESRLRSYFQVLDQPTLLTTTFSTGGRSKRKLDF